jgi:hypothetical protein
MHKYGIGNLHLKNMVHTVMNMGLTQNYAIQAGTCILEFGNYDVRLSILTRYVRNEDQRSDKLDATGCKCADYSVGQH